MTAHKTKTGRTLTDADLDALADDVETTEYDVEELKTRRRGRPAMGSGPADVVPVSHRSGAKGRHRGPCRG